MAGDQENSTAANPPTVMADDPTVSSAPTSCVGANWLASRASRRLVVVPAVLELGQAGRGGDRGEELQVREQRDAPGDLLLDEARRVRDERDRDPDRRQADDPGAQSAADCAPGRRSASP